MTTRWAVLVGINGYHESLGPLRFCGNDARACPVIAVLYPPGGVAAEPRVNPRRERWNVMHFRMSSGPALRR